MSQHTANAEWKGGLKDGQGHLTSKTGGINSNYNFKNRFEGDQSGTSPEELIGAALAGCFSMFLSSLLEKAGSKPDSIKTEAQVTLTVKDDGPWIEKIALTTQAIVAGLSEEDFQKHVQEAKEKCPVSKSLKAVPEITVQASLQ